MNRHRRGRWVVLSGGVGGAKLALGLQAVLPAGRLEVVVNTSDDFEHLGLPICPDLDTLMYTLAGVADPVNGWGRRDDTWTCLQTLESLGGSAWFRLGDRDLATHLRRRELLAGGATLSQATDALRRSFGVPGALHPMSDAPVRTVVHTTEGDLEFQDYFVRRRAEPVVTRLSYRGAEEASAAPGALAALRAPDLAAIVLAPSNPWLSIDPVLSVPALRSSIEERRVPLVAVSPVIAGRAVKGPTAKLMRELGVEPGVAGIARHYGRLLDGLVVDRADADRRDIVEAMGIRTVVTDTLMRDFEDKTRLANCVADFAAELAGDGSA